MTTILGLRHHQVEAAVLVADRQVTRTDRASGLPMGKFLGRKLWKSKDGTYCFGQSGDMSEETQKFMKGFAEGNYDLEEILKKKDFRELRDHNIKRMGRYEPNLKDTTSIILATRSGGVPKLYACFSMGAVEEKEWAPVGSGTEKVNQYMDALQTIMEARDYLHQKLKANLPAVIQIGLEAVRRSQGQDPYSHGLDMMICTPEGINDYHAELGDDFGKKLKKIQRQYREAKK